MENGGAVSGPAPRAVLLADPVRGRQAMVLGEISGLGAATFLLSTSSYPQHTARRLRLAFVAAGSESSDAQSRLDLIRQLRRAGVRVIAYEDGAAQWPLARRCRLLLAGAAYVLDSGSQSFAEEIRALLGRLLGEEIERDRDEARVRALMARMGILGESPALVAAFGVLLRIAPFSDVPVLITGETGTGKELFARAIHRLDPKRCRGPMLAVNCGAIQASLAESELFGHRRGAFTGAERDYAGLFRSADGGVLFLDEIGELDAPVQAKLLRVLQDGRLLGVGDNREVAVNVRVIAATNRDLAEQVRAGRFREDLFHRLGALSVRLPPLRERPEDLLPLVKHFLDKHANLAPEGFEAVTPDFVEALREARLPGNVRQLENIIRWVVVNKLDGSSPSLADLPPELWGELIEATGNDENRASLERRPPALAKIAGAAETAFFDELLARCEGSFSRSVSHCERALLEAALRRVKGNQTRAARLLGITPRSVYNKMRKYGVDAASAHAG